MSTKYMVVPDKLKAAVPTSAGAAAAASVPAASVVLATPTYDELSVFLQAGT